MKNYNQSDVTLSCGGVQLRGYAEGQFCKIAFVTPLFSDKAGTDGDVSRSQSADRRATVEVSLMQTSDSNDYLSGIAALGDAGVFSLLVRDRNGRSLYQAAQAWIEGEPEIMFDGVSTSRVWKIKCAKLVAFTGGN
jgi:hypothetical protein